MLEGGNCFTRVEASQGIKNGRIPHIKTLTVASLFGLLLVLELLVNLSLWAASLEVVLVLQIGEGRQALY